MCTELNKQTYRYDLYEYDHRSVAIRTNKTVLMDFPKIIAKYGSITGHNIIMHFYEQLFPTMTLISGFLAVFEGKEPERYDIIKIQWKTPIWKLVRIK